MAIPKACGGIAEGSFHEVVSGATDNFLAKYGDLADKINLCKRNDSSAAVTRMSEVWGCSLVNREVMCEARGCNGSVDFE